MGIKNRTILRRLRAYPVEKSLGPMLAITVFFLAYFHVLERPTVTSHLMPVLSIDQWMPLIPWTAWVYFSLWGFICVPLSFMENRRVMLFYLSGALALSIIGLSVFFFYPTVVPAWEIDWSHYPSLQFLKNSDRAGNACPSLHVGFAMFSGCWLVWLIRQMRLPMFWLILSFVWGLAIMVSTMTTKQHVFVDVFCGLVLGGLVFWINALFVKKARLEI